MPQDLSSNATVRPHFDKKLPLLYQLFWSILGYALFFFIILYQIFSLGLPFIYIIYLSLGRVIGAGLGKFFLFRIEHYRGFIRLVILNAILLISTFFITQLWLFLAFHVFIGVNEGFHFGLTRNHPIEGDKNVQLDRIEHNGKKKALGIFTVGFLSLPLLFLARWSHFNGIIWFYAVISGSLVGLLILAKTHSPIAPQIELRFHDFTRNPLISITFGFMFLTTFILASIIFISIALLDMNGLNDHFLLYFGYFTLGGISIAFPAGYITDHFGRLVNLILCGLLIVLYLLFTAIWSQYLVFVLYFNPLLVGMIYYSSYIMVKTYRHELHKPNEIKSYSIYLHCVNMAGNLAGGLFIILMLPILSHEPFIVSAFIIILVFLTSLISNSMKETLPPKAELAWKSSLLYLYVIQKSGITVYSENLATLSNTHSPPTQVRNPDDPDDTLLGGALIAINSILQEVAQNTNPVKLVEKDQFTILIETGEHVITAIICRHALQAIRDRLILFTSEFELMFKGALQGGYADIQIYAPTRHIRERIFQ